MGIAIVPNLRKVNGKEKSLEGAKHSVKLDTRGTDFKFDKEDKEDVMSPGIG